VNIVAFYFLQRLVLGPGYDSLKLDISAAPLERDPASVKCTMPHADSHRHLRDYTGLAALRSFGQGNEATDANITNSSDQVIEEQDSMVIDSATTTVMCKGSRTVPSGGRVRVIVSAAGIIENELAQGGARVPDLRISVQGQNLHAPLIERIIELPMDINSGRVNGELVISCSDASSWKFPDFYGRVAVRDATFHFWDATDDIIDADLDLLFEKDRVYLHDARGKFGAVPMRVTGDLDLDPLTGEYRLSATVPGVEVNALRATLGVRPLPFPVAGAVAGTLHVTGPLEKPVFSGEITVDLSE